MSSSLPLSPAFTIDKHDALMKLSHSKGHAELVSNDWWCCCAVCN